jgi:metal-sulfur cluster biosynthetic enzyme
MTAQTAEELVNQIKDALRAVIDPELGYNIIDLGLVYDVAVQEGGAACITMTTTTQGCPATSYLAYGARDSASAVPGIKSVDINLTYEPPWTPEMISPEAKQHLGIRDAVGW